MNAASTTLPTTALLLAALISFAPLARSNDTATQPASVNTTTTATTPTTIPTTTYQVAGLEQSASIRVDTWGVPHIQAQTHYDAFFVQGFNAARDRLWQIDLWRRRGLGQLAAVFGPEYVAQDEAARLFLYRGDMYREWLAYGSDAKRIATAFTAGINAYLDQIKQQPQLLPPEFKLLNYQPARWSADDVVRIRSNGLWRNVTTEVRRAQIACQLGLELAATWKVLEPQWEAQPPPGLDPCIIPKDVLAKYSLAKAPVTFDKTGPELALQDQPDVARGLGSNNWVVAPSRTTTGRPILADDPHRGHAVPSLRYIAHLQAPGLNVIGAGEPALPGISIGHNEKIAFGLTIFPIDQEDLYVYQRTRKGYRYQKGSEPIKAITEQIAVAGEAPRSVTLEFTRHGPIVHKTKRHLFAVRAAWLTEGMSPYFGSVEYMRAQNWRGFVAALNRWGAPSENQVYADTEGNIGYKPAGLFPKRDNWDGLLPVPGDGRYEWDGFFDMDVLPSEFNPERGFTGTANSMNLPPDYPIDAKRIGFEWAAPWRYQSLWRTLAAQPQHSMQDSADLQRSYESVLAEKLISQLPQSAAPGTNDPQVQKALSLLHGWDFVLDRNSAAAALYNLWYHRHLQPQMAQALAPSAPELIEPLDSLSLLKLVPKQQALALAALSGAWSEAQQLLGEDATQWRWGALHRTAFAHPLRHLASAEDQKDMLLPALERGGSGNTTNNTTFDKDFNVRAGASFRMVLDVGNWDAARMTNAPGQSGDWRSPHYQDLLKPWADEGSHPLLYSNSAIEEHTKQRFELVPVQSNKPN